MNIKEVMEKATPGPLVCTKLAVRQIAAELAKETTK